MLVALAGLEASVLLSDKILISGAQGHFHRISIQRIRVDALFSLVEQTLISLHHPEVIFRSQFHHLVVGCQFIQHVAVELRQK